MTSSSVSFARLSLVLIIIGATSGCSLWAKSAADPVGHVLSEGGAASPDELVREYLEGLQKKDAAALRLLAVNQQEYINILLPGTVPPGAPLANMPMKKREYFWASNHTRSQYALLARLGEIGGRALTLKELRYPRPPQEFALYTAWRNPIAVVDDERGGQDELELGSIIEVAGRYKFSSFFWD